MTDAETKEHERDVAMRQMRHYRDLCQDYKSKLIAMEEQCVKITALLLCQFANQHGGRIPSIEDVASNEQAVDNGYYEAAAYEMFMLLCNRIDPY